MDLIIREIYVFTIRLESEKIARSASQIQKLFSAIEEFGISIECTAVNIDWFSVTIRVSEENKVSGLLLKLCAEFPGVNISKLDRIVLLSLEGLRLDCRQVGIIMSSLEMQNVEVQMLRKIKRDKLVIGVSLADLSKAKEIIQEEYHYGVCK